MHYASTASSFRGGTSVNAFCSVRDPHSNDPFATRSILLDIDSYSDITVPHRDIVYGRRPQTKRSTLKPVLPPTWKKV
jgi:hypothetical protein